MKCSLIQNLNFLISENGIREGKNDTWEQCEERVNYFLEEKLDMDTSEIRGTRAPSKREEAWSGETDCCPFQ